MLEVVLREKSKTEGKVNSLVAKVNKLTTQLEEERQLNRSLRQNQVKSLCTLCTVVRGSQFNTSLRQNQAKSLCTLCTVQW
jgi:hypothetical protein